MCKLQKLVCTCTVHAMRTVQMMKLRDAHCRGLHRGPDPGPVRVWVYILNGQLGPGRVPIYYFESRVYLTLCVIPESIREHRTHQCSVSVSMHVFCNLQFVKLGWEKCEREIRWKKKHVRDHVTLRLRCTRSLLLCWLCQIFCNPVSKFRTTLHRTHHEYFNSQRRSEKRDWAIANKEKIQRFHHLQRGYRRCYR